MLVYYALRTQGGNGGAGEPGRNGTKGAPGQVVGNVP